MLAAVHPWDVHGARRAGLTSAWVERTGGAPYPPYLDEPTLRVGGLDRLAPALDDLASPDGSDDAATGGR